jgi:hypothetical protein
VSIITRRSERPLSGQASQHEHARAAVHNGRKRPLQAGISNLVSQSFYCLARNGEP